MNRQILFKQQEKTYEGNIRNLNYITYFRILINFKIKFQQTKLEIDHHQYGKWKKTQH